MEMEGLDGDEAEAIKIMAHTEAIYLKIYVVYLEGKITIGQNPATPGNLSCGRLPKTF
jgi:hypothetical protein